MIAFRIILIALFIYIAGYTALVVSNHGLTLLPVFVGDIAKMEWPGQFNVDFSCFLVLSGLWLAWRHHFSPAGIAMGVVGFFGGALVLTVYLFVASFGANADMRELLLGKERARA